MPIVVGAGKSKVANKIAEKALKIHVMVEAHLEVVNAKYKIDTDMHWYKKLLQECDLVMAYLWESRFLNVRTKMEKCKYIPILVA